MLYGKEDVEQQCPSRAVGEKIIVLLSPYV